MFLSMSAVTSTVMGADTVTVYRERIRWYCPMWAARLLSTVTVPAAACQAVSREAMPWR